MRVLLLQLGIEAVILAVVWFAFHPSRALMLAIMFVSLLAVVMIVDGVIDKRRERLYSRGGRG